MDVLATLALIQTAVNALKAGSTVPTANFATQDIQTGITNLATSVGVTPVQLTAPAPTS